MPKGQGRSPSPVQIVHRPVGFEYCRLVDRLGHDIQAFRFVCLRASPSGACNVRKQHRCRAFFFSILLIVAGQN